MINLKAQKRTLVGKRAKTIRKDGLVPAIVYGHGIDNVVISVPIKEFQKASKDAGEGLLSLEIENDKPRKVLIHDMYRNPLTSAVEHIDFFQIKEGEMVEVEIPILFIGESPAVKGGNVFVPYIDAIKIQCLPENIPHEVKIDISKLEKVGERLSIIDIALPKEIKILHKESDIIAAIEAPISEEEVKQQLAEKPEEKVEAVGVVEKPKKVEEGEEKEVKK